MFPALSLVLSFSAQCLPRLSLHTEFSFCLSRLSYFLQFIANAVQSIRTHKALLLHGDAHSRDWFCNASLPQPSWNQGFHHNRKSYRPPLLKPTSVTYGIIWFPFTRNTLSKKSCMQTIHALALCAAMHITLLGMPPRFVA